MLQLKKLSGYCAVFLALIYAAFAVIVPAPFKKNPGFIYEPHFVAAYWSAIGTMLIAYMIGEFEREDKEFSKIEARQYFGVECFYHSTTFHSRLSDVNEGAELIMALNFSPHPTQSTTVNHYFENLDKYVNSTRARLSSYMVIVNCDNEVKANWLAQRAKKSEGNGRVSLARLSNPNPSTPMMCYHLVQKDGVGCVFVFPLLRALA